MQQSPNQGPKFSPPQQASEKDQLPERVNQAKRRVIEALGGKPSPEMRASQVYQAYTGLCAEAHIAQEDKALTEEIVAMLEDYATKVVRQAAGSI